MTDAPRKAMSEAEYLRTERESPYKREYVGGFVYPLHAQAGASGEHVRISGRIMAALLPDADRQGCRLYQSDMQLYNPGSKSYFYPDVMLVCGGEPPDRYYETSPCLLVEVLSGSTAHNDRRTKYQTYTAVPTLQTYLIVSQDERHVVEYQRTGGGWQMREHRGEGQVEVPCLGRTLTLDEMYRGVL
ncbi:Uma2 family endonuclease [Deinococcus aluminii]|uniref:Putative restriction endonuclease domain-containing protein n=1 Tax=Deinococcus aluminii TaxID=1656885 RepID=A0ABP9X9F8_9DEIO